MASESGKDHSRSDSLRQPASGCRHKLLPGARFCTVCGRPAAGGNGPAAAQQGPQPRESPPVTPRRSGSAPPSASRRAWRVRWRTSQLVLSAVLLLLAGAAATVALLHPFRAGPAPAAASRSLSVSASGAAGEPGEAQSPEQRAARGLAALLAQSVADRSSVVQAVSDVNDCGANLSQDAQTFASAANSRQNLLSQLASLPGGSSLPAQVIQSLKKGWQASAQADEDFARWARDENSQGCTPSDHSDPGYSAAVGPDAQASAEKRAFTGLWDPIAAQYALTAYRWDQL